jgi:predicted PolB exonuclease-like 3'-5' exonuclease
MKVLVNDFESFKYFLDKKNICKGEEEMIDKFFYIRQNEKDYLEKYNVQNVIKKIKKII